MPNAPDEIVAAPLTFYLAVVGTAFPEIDDLPADFDPAWEVLGTEGDANYDDTGVKVTLSETVNDFTPAGRTMPSKRFRVGELCQFGVNVVDLSPDVVAKVMNDAQIATTVAGSGIAGKKRISLIRGDQVNSFALLARGMSPVNNDLNLQFRVSKAFVSVNGDAIFNKGVPTMLPVEMLATNHSGSDVIDVEMQTADAT